MTRRKTPPHLKKKVIKALEKGAVQGQILKWVSEWTLYRITTPEERQMAKAKHDTIIDNIFNS